ncbi:MAG: hypothetical protein ACHQ03_10830 [Candidatus Bathyarchaeia archaeon]
MSIEKFPEIVPLQVFEYVRVVRLRKTGPNSFAVTIAPRIVQMLEWTKGKQLILSVDEAGRVILESSRAKKPKRDELLAVFREIKNELHEANRLRRVRT